MPVAVPAHTTPHDRSDIQGLRGVAVLVVVAYHAGVGPQGGFLGVDVFLVISGFVIGTSLVEERVRTGSVRLRSFFARRVRRLLPAMAVFTVVTAVASVLVLSPFSDQQRALSTATAATVFVANVQLYRTTGYFDGSAQRNPYLHTWSLSLEEQFYLMLAVVLVGTWWLWNRRTSGDADAHAGPLDVERDTRRVAAIAVTVLGAVSLLVAFALTQGWVNPGLQAPARLAFFSMPTRIWQFAAGFALAALGARTSQRLSPSTAAVLGIGGAAALVAAVVSMDPLAPVTSGWVIVVVAASAVLIACGTDGGNTGPVTAILSSRWLVWFGDRSYSWYLWHLPPVVFAGVLWPGHRWVLPAGAVASLVPAVLSYRFVERPFRFGEKWRGARTAAMAVVCIAVPLAVLVGLRAGAVRNWGLDAPSGWYDLPATYDTSCHVINRDAANGFDLAGCSFGPERTDAGGTVLLLGDGLADSVGPAVVEVAEAKGWRTVQWSRDGCPLVEGAAGPHHPMCAAWQAEALDLVAELRPDAVVVANQSLDERQRERLPETIRLLDASTDKVVLVAPIADFGDAFPLQRMSLVDPHPVVPSMSLDELEAQRSDVMSTLRSASSTGERGGDGVTLVDPAGHLCGRECAPLVNQRWLYLGPRALTATGARRLTGELAGAIGSG